MEKRNTILGPERDYWSWIMIGTCIYRQFEAVTRYCNNYTKTMPVILLLGFFTSTTMQRWFMTQTSVPGTSRAICVFSMSLKENTPDVSISACHLISICISYSTWLESDYVRLIVKRQTQHEVLERFKLTETCLFSLYLAIRLNISQRKAWWEQAMITNQYSMGRRCERRIQKRLNFKTSRASI